MKYIIKTIGTDLKILVNGVEYPFASKNEYIKTVVYVAQSCTHIPAENFNNELAKGIEINCVILSQRKTDIIKRKGLKSIIHTERVIYFKNLKP